MIVELFYAEGCAKCIRARDTLKKAAVDTIPQLVWRELNVLEELDYAVELGVLNLPAIAIDKELVFTSLPSPERLVMALHERQITKVQHGN